MKEIKSFKLFPEGWETHAYTLYLQWYIFNNILIVVNEINIHK